MRPAEARILLGLRGEPSEEELLHAYRAMLRAWHPDRFPLGSDLHAVSNQRTRSIVEAFKVLQEERALREKLGPVPAAVEGGFGESRRPRDPLRFDGPTPEKTIATSEPSPRREPFRLRFAAAAVVTAILSAGVFAMARGGAPVQGAELPIVAPSDESMSVQSDSDSDSRRTAPSVARYSIAIGAFSDRNRARTVVQRLREEAPEVWATVVPVQVNEAVFHRILVGFAGDRQALGDVSDRVSRALDEDSATWIVREAGVSLCVPDVTSAADARTLVENMEEQGISSFAVRVSAEDGGQRIRVCSGSFQGPAEADYLRQVLIREGFSPSLEARVGEPVDLTVIVQTPPPAIRTSPAEPEGEMPESPRHI